MKIEITENLRDDKFAQYKKIVKFIVDPVGKPRMVNSDRWKTNPKHPDEKVRMRAPVWKYRCFQNDLLKQAGRFVMPACIYQPISLSSRPRMSWSCPNCGNEVDCNAPQEAEELNERWNDSEACEACAEGGK